MNPLLLLVALPLLDFFLLIWIGRHTSAGFALALFAGGVVAGVLLLRRVSRISMRAMQSELAAGRTPLAAAGKTVSLFAAAVLLIVPGVISDALALVLLVPLGRRLLGHWLATRLHGHVQVRGFSAFDEHAAKSDGHDRIIDVHVVDVPTDSLNGPDDGERGPRANAP
jgi:UPF0716 protein FxsA